eukprot:scaffold70110_cov31-Tisochrysis_lutea.AAC.4
MFPAPVCRMCPSYVPASWHFSISTNHPRLFPLADACWRTGIVASSRASLLVQFRASWIGDGRRAHGTPEVTLLKTTSLLRLSRA